MKCNLCQQEFALHLPITDLISVHPLLLDAVCSDCLASLEQCRLVKHCPYCSYPTNLDKCPECNQWQKYQLKHQSLYYYNDQLSSWLTMYKIKGHYQLRTTFLRSIYYELQPVIQRGFHLVLIPTHPRKLKERGFDPLLAMFELLPYPLECCLQTVSYSDQKSKTRDERLATSQLFQLKYKPKTKKICLIDDIYTTGRTITHAYSLLQPMCEEICSFSLFRGK